MELHEVRYFLTLCETLNFRRAAERSNVTQPALTRAIQKLEQEFGGLLFSRDRQPAHLTELGRLIQPQMQEIFRHAEGVKNAAHQFLTLEDAPLRVGVMSTLGPVLFARFLSGFNDENPGVGIGLRDGTPGALTTMLLNDTVDVAVLAQPGPVADGLHVQPLYRERFTVAFGPGHRFESQQYVTLADMDGEIYLRRVNCEFREFFAQLLAERGVGIKVRYQSDREEWVQTLVTGGFGICLLPEHLRITPGLRIRPLVEPEVTRTISLVTAAGRRFTPAAARFVRQAMNYEWPDLAPVVYRFMANGPGPSASTAGGF
jgi:DNA-binding transcriptional LysR family regulator